MAKVVRCQGKRQALLIDDCTWEVKCDSRVCGAGPGKVVLHRFDVHTGELLETLRFRDPGRVAVERR